MISMNTLSNYRYKVTYLNDSMCSAFVRIADDAILYANPNELYVILYAEGFCNAKCEKFYIE